MSTSALFAALNSFGMSNDDYLNPYTSGQLTEGGKILGNVTKRLEKFKKEEYELRAMFHRPYAKAKIAPEFPSSVFNRSVVVRDGDDNNKCTLVESLPEEIKLQIFSELDVPDAVCFALTCTRQATTFTRLGQIDKYKKEQASKVAKAAAKTSGKGPVSGVSISRKQRLDVLVRLHGWMNESGTEGAHWKLCYGCCRYKDKAAKPNAPWTGDPMHVRERKTAPAAQKTGPHCPSCTKRVKMEAVQHRQEYKEAQKKTAALCK